MDYTALQVKTSYSILESLNSISKLVSRASSLGYTSLSITDTNNLFGVIEFYLECKKYNIKPIIGIEVRYFDTIFLLYAINEIGYKKIINISLKISEKTLSINDLEDNNNIIIVYPYSSFNKEIFDKFKYKYVGYSNSVERDNIDNSYKKVFINNVSYIDKDDYKYLDYLFMIKEGKVLGEYELNTHINEYLLSYDEVLKVSNKEDILNTKEISDMCNLTIGYKEGLLPVYDKNINSFEYLSMLCNKGLKRRLNDDVSELYQNRLDYELSIIKQMGFCDYFLVVWDYVKYAKFHDILVGPGRGSAAGSLVSYTLGITDIDPIKYDLLFERFLNPERVTMPDIDIDFDNEKIDEVINYVINKYGKKKVAGIITFMRMSAKQVIRDVGRVLKINLPIIDAVSKQIIYPTLLENMDKNISFKRIINSSEELKRLYNISLKLEGLIRNPSIHAAGIVMSRYSIDETIPLYKSDSGMYLTAFTKDYLEPLGLLKMDFLRLATLSFIDDVIKNIRKQKGIDITFSKIPLDDKKTLKIFYDVKTDGIFQFESDGMKNFLSKLKVSSFDDIVAALALFRPGPMDNIDTYIRRKEGKEKIDYIDSSLEPILKSTYGIIIYQEQIMEIAKVMAGYTYGEADVLRRAMSKKDESKLLKERPKFIEGAVSKGYSLDKANYVFDLILKFADYGFNKSHSVAYAIIGYKMAFLKTYFPMYFLASSLTNVIGNEYKTKMYLQEARSDNIKILCPNINYSGYKYEVVDNSIRCPISIIKNIGKVGYNEIEKEKKNCEFVDFTDFVVRCYSQSLNKKSIISLVLAGCFDEFGYNKKTLVNNLDNIINYAELVNDGGMIELEKPELEYYEEYSKEELVNYEYNVYGFYLLSHPTLIYKNNNDVDLVNIDKYYDKKINIVVVIDRVKEILTKKNDAMLFVYGSDNTGSIDITLFPNVYLENKDINKKDVIRVFGRVEKRYDRYQIIADKVSKLN